MTLTSQWLSVTSFSSSDSVSSKLFANACGDREPSKGEALETVAGNRQLFQCRYCLDLLTVETWNSWKFCGSCFSHHMTVHRVSPFTVDQWMLRWVGVAWNLHKSPSCTTEAFDRRSWWGQGGHRPSLLRLDDGQRMTAESTRWGKDMIVSLLSNSNTLQLMAVAKHRIIEWWYLPNRWQILSTLIRLQFPLSI